MLVLPQLRILFRKPVEVVTELIDLCLHLTWALQEVDELCLSLVQVLESALSQKPHHVEPLHAILVILVRHLLPSLDFLSVCDFVDSSEKLRAPNHASRGSSMAQRDNASIRLKLMWAAVIVKEIGGLRLLSNLDVLRLLFGISIIAAFFLFEGRLIS